MTLEDTRRLGIEFERRVQTMIPDKEFIEKLDTETIYSYLNQYQDKYIHEIFRSLDQIPSGSKLSVHVDSVLQPLLNSKEIKIDDSGVVSIMEDGIPDNNGMFIIDTARSVKYPLPSDFYMYVKSVSRVSSTFSFRGNSNSEQGSIRILPNQLVSQNDIWKLVETPHNTLRILRYPAAVLSENRELSVVYDQYTTPLGIRITYYKEPAHFSLMTSTACELPIDAFEELVSGAVDLYVQYVAGAVANKERIQRAREEAAKEAERNNARRNRREE